MSFFGLLNNDEDSRNFEDLPSPSDEELDELPNLGDAYICASDALYDLIGEVKAGPCTKSRCKGRMELDGEIYRCNKCGKIMDQEDYILWMTDFDL